MTQISIYKHANHHNRSDCDILNEMQVVSEWKWRQRMRIAAVLSGMPDREEISGMLKRINPECEIVGTACDGAAGYEMICAVRPELVITEAEMPGGDGFTMLRKLRDRKIDVRVIVLAEGEDFQQARQAIELSADGFLKKPVRQKELRTAVEHIEEKLKEDRAEAAVFTAENIFMSCINGQLQPDENFHEMTRKRLGFTVEDPGAVFALWLGDEYEKQKEKAKGILGETKCAGGGMSSRVLEAGAWNLLLVVLYRMEEPGAEREYFRKKVVPKLCAGLEGVVVCLWAEMKHLTEMLDVLRKMQRMRDWNLLFDRGDLIWQEEIERLETMPLKYPADLESQVRRAVTAKRGEEIKKCYYRLYDLLRRKPYSPADMKGCLIRFDMAVLNTFKVQQEIESEIDVQRCMQAIASAMSWAEIRGVTEQFFQLLNFDAFEEKSDEGLSPLVRKAVQLVRKYYDQGITLDEIAERLFVSEEYLSTQFKKETGVGFKETVRKYRIERIKGLLIGTRLKLNQIAELTGYADSKYMSRVFKEETGMLPTEYRKSAH